MLNIIHDTPGKLRAQPMIDPGIVDSKRLQMFYASVKEGSFAGAAQLLSVSPSAISHAMKGLEEDLGCPLFRRFGPQVKPTAAAVCLLPMVEDLLQRMSTMKSELATLDGRAESLVFRLPASLIGVLQPGVLSTFHECFPEADFQIILLEEGAGELLGRRVDFDIDYLQRVPDEMVRRDLAVEEFHAYAAPFHGLGQKSRISLADMKHGLVIFSDQFSYECLSPQFERNGSVGMRKWILPDPRAAGELARQGQGIVFLPEWAAASAVREGKLVCPKLPGIELRRTWCAWWDPKQPLTWVAEVFLSLLSATIDPAEDGE